MLIRQLSLLVLLLASAAASGEPAPWYWWVSQLAMLPATVVFLNAGRELGKVSTLRDILSPGMVFAFTLLGLLPLVTRRLFTRYTPSSKK